MGKLKLTLGSARAQAFLLSALQAGLILACASVWLLLASWQTAAAALLGGGVWWLPNLYFAYRVFRRREARAAQRIVRAFYWNELVKWLLVAILWIISLHLLPTTAQRPFISGFMVALLAVWLTPCYMLYQPVSKP